MYKLEKFPIDYAMTQHNLGNAYTTLAEVEGKPDNCRLAIAALEETLKVFKLENFPVEYAITQNDLGNANRKLSDLEGRVEVKIENSRLAIAAYGKSLKILKLESFPVQYAAIMHNLGTAYCDLAGLEEKVENCRMAVAAYEEALKVRTVEALPMDYAMSQNALGVAYWTMALMEKDVHVKSENCRLAVTAFEQALKVYSLDKLPVDYAMAQNNRGLAYRTLAEVENRQDNCKRAIAAFRESLRVRMLETRPVDYAKTQESMGFACWSLAEVEDKAENCRLAMHAFSEALKVFTPRDFPERSGGVQSNLARLVDFCRHN